MSIASTGTTARRRWHRLPRAQFSVRALLLLTIVTAIALGWIVGVYRTKEHAIERLGDVGALIMYQHDWTSARAVRNETPGRLWLWLWLRRWLGEHCAADVTAVELFVSTPMRPQEFTDDDAALLTSLPTIEELTLYRTRVSDAGLMRLASLPRLRRLDVEGTLVTAEGVKRFRAARPDVALVSSFDR